MKHNAFTVIFGGRKCNEVVKNAVLSHTVGDFPNWWVQMGDGSEFCGYLYDWLSQGSDFCGQRFRFLWPNRLVFQDSGKYAWVYKRTIKTIFGRKTQLHIELSV